jgi:hypothetical protein
LAVTALAARRRGPMKLLLAAVTLFAVWVCVVAACGGSKNPGGWINSCVHSNHPAFPDGGCGWLAAPGLFVFCHDYPDGIQAQLTCYSPLSGWEVNIPADDPPGKQPSARRVKDDVRRGTAAMEMKAGHSWYDSMPERTAEVVCQAAKRFFRCDLRGYRVWFKPDGTFALDQRKTDPKTFEDYFTLIYRG